mmetsp:Transcript_4052/g.6149  ORF Transcript_4052/g.6149 Transcript_4052/m.6149 type:complete len:102 (+) Transcript_4052:178-483(+)
MCQCDKLLIKIKIYIFDLKNVYEFVTPQPKRENESKHFQPLDSRYHDFRFQTCPCCGKKPHGDFLYTLIDSLFISQPCSFATPLLTITKHCQAKMGVTVSL